MGTLLTRYISRHHLGIFYPFCKTIKFSPYKVAVNDDGYNAAGSLLCRAWRCGGETLRSRGRQDRSYYIIFTLDESLEMSQRLYL